MPTNMNLPDSKNDAMVRIGALKTFPSGLAEVESNSRYAAILANRVSTREWKLETCKPHR